MLAVVLLLALLPMASAERAGADDEVPRERTPSWPSESSRDVPGPVDEQAVPHIINGTPISITERPWHVLVSDEGFGGSWCGGNLIAPNVVLTAAHCVDNPFLSPSTLLVVAGSSTFRDLDNGQWRFAASVTIHPLWEPGGDFGVGQGPDLALIELDRPVVLGPAVQPIEIADAEEASAVLGQPANLVGWGVTSLPALQGDTSTVLRSGSGEVVSDTFCSALIGRSLNGPLELCVDSIATGQAGCFGDSGGGATVEIDGVDKLIGVASFTAFDCAIDVLGFAETTWAIDWIERNMPPIDTRTAFIDGRVFDDTDFDSVEDPGEAGMPNVRVELTIEAPFDDVVDVRLTTFTDADGRYAFNAPSGGWYSVKVEVPPTVVLSPPEFSDDPTTNSDLTSRTLDELMIEDTVGSTDRFLVRPGDVINDIDAGAVQGAIISGVVFDDLDGDGQRSAAEPLSGSVDGFIDLYREGALFYIDTRDLLFDNAYVMAVPPGANFLSFYDSQADRSVTLPDRGNDISDNDFSPFTRETAVFQAVAGETYTFDLGLTPEGSGPVFVDVANADCDNVVSIIDALFIAQYSAGVRTDGGTCPLADPTSELNAADADFNLDGTVDIIDALLVAQCDARQPTPYCDSLDG